MPNFTSNAVKQANHVASLTNTVFNGFDEEGNLCFITTTDTARDLRKFLVAHNFNEDTQIHIDEGRKYVRVRINYFGLSEYTLF